jgi:hypothetical protein
MLTDEDYAALEERWMKAYESSYFNKKGIPFDGAGWLNKNLKVQRRAKFREWRCNNMLRRRQSGSPPPSAATYLKQVNDTQITDDYSLS